MLRYKVLLQSGACLLEGALGRQPLLIIILLYGCIPSRVQYVIGRAAVLLGYKSMKRNHQLVNYSLKQ